MSTNPAAQGDIQTTQFPSASPQQDAKWFVLHCKPRQEQSVVDHLDALDAYAYFPKVPQVRFYNKRKVKRLMPLFPGYVFLYGQQDDAYSVDRARGLVQIIKPEDQEQLVWELENIHLALTQEAPLTECSGLKAGTRVEVRSGPFKGMQGLVEAGKASDRIILQVSMLGRAMSLEIDGSLLEIIVDDR